MSGFNILGYLCFLASLIFGILGMAIDPAANLQDWSKKMKPTDVKLHTNITMQNTTYSMFAQTLALLGLGFFYLGNQ